MKTTEIAAFCSDEIRSFNQKGLLCGTYLPYPLCSYLSVDETVINSG